jgi:tetratricopeptide (TPR) repeat protein
VLKPVPWSESLREHARWESARSGIALRQSRHQEAWNYATSALMKAQLVEDWSTAAHAALMVDNLVTSLRWNGVVVQRPDVVALCRLAGDTVSEAKYLSNRAVDHYFEGDWRRAVALYRESAERSAEYGHAVSEATCLNNIAEILSDQGRYDDAAAMFREASRTWRSIGYGIGIAYADNNLGRLATRTGRHDEARRLLADAADRFRALGSTSDLTEVALRTIDDLLVAGDPVPDELWPSESELDVDPTLRVAGDRLMALAASDARVSLDVIERSIAGARAAEIPFELALSLRVRAALTGDESAAAEADSILSALEVVTPPPLPARLKSSALVE